MLYTIFCSITRSLERIVFGNSREFFGQFNWDFRKFSGISLCKMNERNSNQSPIIGILCLEIARQLEKAYGSQFKSYIAASYVKFLETSGARVVPVWIGREKAYYEEMLKQLNGVLLPGGAVWFTEFKGFAEAGKYIFEIAEKMNGNGDFIPLWGTCLGYELLLHVSANGRELRQDCDAMKDSLPLEFKPESRSSRMFGKVSDDIFEVLRNESVTYNFHRYCITEEDLDKFNLSEQWRVMSTNKDKNGLEFISSTEHKKYPFYGVQFHPEKNAFEWMPNRNFNHSSSGIRACQYFADFFVSECRKSRHRFEHFDEENRHLINNFPKTFTGISGSQFMECYLFLQDVDYPSLSCRAQQARDE